MNQTTPAMSAAMPVVDRLRPLDGVELVLFDLDGTLIDSVPSLAQAVDTMLQQLGRAAAGVSKVRQWVGNGAQTLVERALSDSRQIDPELDQALRQQALALFMEAYSECADHGALLYPGVRDCLEALRQRSVELAIITNKPARFLPSLLASLALDQYFGKVIGGDSLNQKKPHPLPLLHCLDHFGVAASRALMVGDSAADVSAARAAGVSMAAVSYGYSYPQPVAAYQPDWLVDCVTELL